jgi:hypothetical protein
MYWQIEIPLIVRHLISDLEDPPTYSDARIQQLAVIAAQYVVKDVNLKNSYNIDIVGIEITPDPSDPETRDTDFISFIGLKTACLLDQASLRFSALSEGISATLGPASLKVGGYVAAYQSVLENGPCTTYAELTMQHNIGNATAIRAVLSPFVGSNFDPLMLHRGYNKRNDMIS